MTDGFVNDHASALGSGCVGRDEYRRRLPGFLASMPGLRYEAGEPIVDGDRVAAPYDLHATGRTPDGDRGAGATSGASCCCASRAT